MSHVVGGHALRLAYTEEWESIGAWRSAHTEKVSDTMAEDAHEERFRQHEDILRSLTAMLAAQHEMNRQQVEINQDVKTTRARIETLLARMIRHEDNGREA